jgi:hypothetical protein
MTLVVLALDALDAKLVDYWDLDDLRLHRYGEMETFANMRDVPYTPEVWATVATGLEPNQHGITDEGTSQWSNPLVDLASRFTGHLPLSTRARLGDIAEDLTGAKYSLGETDAETIFDRDGRVVHTWPGAGPSEDVIRIWNMMKPHQGSTHEEFQRDVLGIGAQQFAWAEEMLNHNVVLAGTHIHTLDVCGHAYGDDHDRYRQIYDWIAEWVARIRDSLQDDDDLLVLSDHGIHTKYCHGEDVTPGSHSWHAFASTTIEETPPTSVFEVREWIERHVEKFEAVDTEAVEMPVEQLRELGYIE